MVLNKGSCKLNSLFVFVSQNIYEYIIQIQFLCGTYLITFKSNSARSVNNIIILSIVKKKL